MRHVRSILGMVLTFASLIAAAAADDPVSYHLSTPRKVYLVGEPITLEMRLTNQSGEPLQSYDAIDGPQTEFLIDLGPAGGVRKRLKSGSALSGSKVQTNPLVLKPGGAWCFRHRIGLSLDDNRTFLVLPEPGRYEIQVQYPWKLYGGRKGIEFQPPAKSLIVEIRRAVGRDGDVWKMLWHREIITAWTDGFLRSEPTDDDRFVLRTCEQALRLNPKGGYAAELKKLLRDYYAKYYKEMESLAPPARRELLRLIEWREPEQPKEPFHEDRRLDQEITVSYSKRTPWPEVFADFTKQSGVEFKVDPDLATLWTSSISQKVRLRDEVRRYHHMNGVRFFKEGEGYVLKRVPPTPPDPASLVPPYAPCFDVKIEEPATAELP